MFPLTPLLTFLKDTASLITTFAIIFTTTVFDNMITFGRDTILAVVDNAVPIFSFAVAVATYWAYNEFVQGRPLHVPSCMVRAWGGIVGVIGWVAGEWKELGKEKMEGKKVKTVEFEDLSDFD